jgi:hypothetical protein
LGTFLDYVWDTFLDIFWGQFSDTCWKTFSTIFITLFYIFRQFGGILGQLSEFFFFGSFLGNVFGQCFGNFYGHSLLQFWETFFTFFAYKWQTPRENVHEVGQPIGMRTTVELSDVHNIVLVFKHSSLDVKKEKRKKIERLLDI